MSNKLECVGCGSYTSAIADAFEDGRPCPCCALPAEAALAVQAARRSQADEKLIQRYLDAERRATMAEAQAALLRYRLTLVTDALTSAPDGM